eukprot:14863083-Alexandrium_andersonii.AAC.1
MDNEPALVDLRAGVAEKLGLQAVEEAPPAHEPQPNGSVENSVKQLRGLPAPSRWRFRRRPRGGRLWAARQ